MVVLGAGAIFNERGTPVGGGLTVAHAVSRPLCSPPAAAAASGNVEGLG